jgi:hypothetical protein
MRRFELVQRDGAVTIGIHQSEHHPHHEWADHRPLAHAGSHHSSHVSASSTDHRPEKPLVLLVIGDTGLTFRGRLLLHGGRMARVLEEGTASLLGIRSERTTDQSKW